MTSRAIAICNQKGGVGKSTTAVNLGAYLALSGRKTLILDLDPQGNATTSLGIKRAGLEKDTYAVLMAGMPIREAIVATSVERLSLLPASLDLAGAEPELAGADERETILKRVLEPVRNEFQYVLFDCPPSLGLLTVNALVAADSTIIPVQCEYLALEGLNALIHAAGLIKERLNPSLRVGGIVLTMADFRANLTREVAQEVRQFFHDRVFSTTIPRSIRLAESPSFGKPICLYDPESAGASAYHMLTQEVLSQEVEVIHDDETTRTGISAAH